MIRIEKLRKTYITNKSDLNTVIVDFNLEIADQGMFFLLGKSGSGKTTLLNLIGGLDNYDEGNIIINGNSTNIFNERDYDLYRREIIGFVFQEHNIINGFTVYKNLSIALELQGKNVDEREIYSALREVELEDFVDRTPDELSTGEKQRVAIARALVNSPQIILADEPTGSLDSETSKIVLDQLKKLSKDRLVIIITHDRETALKYGDRIVEIADGKITDDILINEMKILNSETKENKYISKSQIKFKNIIKLSYMNLLLKRTRLIFTLLLSTIAFTLFGIADTISSYDDNTALLHSLEDVNRDYVFLQKISIIEDEIEGEFIGQHPSFNYEDINTLTSDFSIHEFYQVFFNFNNNYEIDVNTILRQKYNYDGGEYFTFDINGSTEISEELLDKLNIDLVAGRLPTQNDSDNEVVISKYTYDTFKVFGYKIGEDVVDIVSYNDIIGKTIFDFLIVGIVDTHLNEGRYSLLDTDDLEEDTKRNISLEFQKLCNYGLHTMLFFREGYYTDVIDSQEVNDINSIIIQVYSEGIELKLGQINSTTEYEGNEDNVILIDDMSRDNLIENEIIIPFDMLPSYGMTGVNIIDTYSNIDELITNEVNRLIEEFVDVNFQYIEDEFALDHLYPVKTDYENYIKENEINEYQQIYNYSYFLYEARYIVLNTTLFPYFNTELKTNFNNFGELHEDIKVKVVGVYFPEVPSFDSGSFEGELDNPLLVSATLFDFLDDEIGSLIVSLSSNNSSNLSLIELGKDSQNNDIVETEYILQSEYKTMIGDAGEFIRLTAIILVSVGGFFAIFAGLLLYNFISTSIRYKQKDIGILRSIGASSKDVFKIFFYESLVIALICFILSLFLTIPITLLFDKVLQKEFYVPVSFLSVGFRQVSLLLLISVFVAIIATLVPIYSFSKKKPIDIIKNVL